MIVLALAAGLTGARPVAAFQSERDGWAPLRADGNGLTALRVRVAITAKGEPLADVLRSIRVQSGLGLVFETDLPGLDRRITFTDSTRTAAEALLRVLEGSGLRVLVAGSGQAVLVRAAGGVEKRDTLAGIVREAGSGPPIAEAEVSVEGGQARTFTNRDGRFVLSPVPDGSVVLVVRRIGYATARQPVTDRAIPLVVELQLAPAPLSAVIVSPGTFGVLEETTAHRTLTRDEIEKAPQLGEDPLRSISRLPGVVGHDLTSNFGIRGSAGREVLLRLDGVDLIEPYHLKDVDAALSIIDIDAIGGVELMTGGFGAQYGDRTAGVFDMRTATVRPGRPRTTLGLSLTNLRAASAGTFAGDRGDWLFSARRGYIDLALKLGGSDDNLSPRYEDVLGKVEYRFSPRTKLSAHLLWAGDRLHWKQSSDPDLDSRYGSAYAWLRLDAGIGSRMNGATVVSTGRVTWDRTGFQAPSDNELSLDVLEDRDWKYVGIRQELQYEAAPAVLLRGGFDVQARQADYDYDSRTDRLTPVDPFFFRDVEYTSVHATPGETWTGAWLSSRFRPVAPLTLEVGARWDRHTHTGDSDVGPRLNAAWSIDRNTTLRAAWGRYFQAQGLQELQVQDGARTFQPSERAEHRVIGLERSLPFGLDVRVDAYDRQSTRLQSRYVNLIDNGDVFPELSLTRILIEPDEGFARGIELYVRHRATRGLDWSASWSRSSAKERIDGRWVPRPRDQRYAFGFDVAYTADGRWRFSTAWQYHSGWPWTATTVSVDTVGSSLWVSRNYGPYNASRLPAYHRLDVRISREARTRRGRVLFFIDVYNLYGRKNARTLVPYLYSINNGKPEIRVETDTLLPRLPSFGIQWEF
jgi:TonB dependent receptor-like, beta-barrel/Carboxypeptidase regulatory-like domain/TonB-dependent Receptor Plug Domain